MCTLMVFVVRLGFHAPYLIHELDTGEYLAGIGQELVKKIELLAGSVWLSSPRLTVRES